MTGGRKLYLLTVQQMVYQPSMKLRLADLEGEKRLLSARLSDAKNPPRSSSTPISRRPIDGLVSAIAEGMRSPSLAGRLESLEAERAEIARVLDGPAPTPVRLHPNLALLYRQKIQALKAALDNEDIRTEALTIIRGLIEAVVVHPTVMGYEIELVGEIASMVELATGADNKKAARLGAALNADERRSVKLVAGARFELTTFRL